MIRVSKKKQAEYMHAKRAPQPKVKKLGVGIDGWGLVLPDGVQPEIGQEWIENGEYRRVNADGQIEDGWGVNCPDGRYRGDR